MRTKYTPGPWKQYYAPRLRPGFGRTPINQVEDEAGEAVIFWTGFDSCCQSRAEKKANARLIAASPEMADELVWLIECMEGVLIGEYEPDDQTVAAAKKVLKKAGVL